MKKFNLNSTVGEVSECAEAKAILEEKLGDLSHNAYITESLGYPLSVAVRYASFVGISSDEAKTLLDKILEIDA